MFALASAGNWEETNELCFIDDNLKEVVDESRYVTKLPDKTLYLKINMSSVLRADIPVVKDRSDQVVDAHNADERTSTTFMIMVPVKPASADPGFIKTAQCQMRVSTLPSSSSGENKFKASSLPSRPLQMATTGTRNLEMKLA
eukprot:gene7314-432_t